MVFTHYGVHAGPVNDPILIALQFHYDQGMPELETDERELILNYLAAYLGRDVAR